MHREGYIRGFKKVEIENNKNEFEIELKYVDGEPVIKTFQEFQLLVEEFIQKLKIYRETSMDWAYQYYQPLKECYQTMKREPKRLVVKFCVRFLIIGNLCQETVEYQ